MNDKRNKHQNQEIYQNRKINETYKRLTKKDDKVKSIAKEK
jgi:hypothetical protein